MTRFVTSHRTASANSKKNTWIDMRFASRALLGITFFQEKNKMAPTSTGLAKLSIQTTTLSPGVSESLNIWYWRRFFIADANARASMDAVQKRIWLK